MSFPPSQVIIVKLNEKRWKSIEKTEKLKGHSKVQSDPLNSSLKYAEIL